MFQIVYLILMINMVFSIYVLDVYREHKGKVRKRKIVTSTDKVSVIPNKESESEKHEERERHIKAERQKIGGGETCMIKQRMKDTEGEGE